MLCAERASGVRSVVTARRFSGKRLAQTDNILQTSRWDIVANIWCFLLCPIRQTLIFVTRRKTLVVFYTYTLMWKKRYYFTATSERRRAGAEAVPTRKPRSERHGWETSFKQALLLRAKGAIRAFFDGYCRGDVASGVRSVAITR